MATKGSLARCRNPAKGLFSGFAVATNYSFIQNQQQQGSLGRKQKYFFLQSQDCIERDLWLDSGIQQRVRFPDSESQQNSHSCRVRNATNITYSSSGRIATKGVFGQIQETSKGLVPQIRDCNAVGIPPESGLQQNTYSSRVRGATKGSLAVFRNPAKGSFPILEGATI